MNGSRSFRVVLLVAVNFLLNCPVNGGVVKRSSRMVREIYPPDIEPENDGNQPQVCIVGDVVYGAEETVPAEQPCLKCRCQPPGVQCETVQCAKKPGCKAIHRSNKCCPDYQCECEHNGKIYANGEKLETNPGGECKVCYCRGGEIQCAEVSCYIRNDCEGKRVQGTCCPKYDHCPPIDPVPDRSIVVTEPSLTNLKPALLDLWQDLNSTQAPILSTLSSFPEDSNKVPDTNDLATIAPAIQENPQIDENVHHRITIQEIIPERKEIPITAPPKTLITEPQRTLVIEESLPTNENTSNDLNVDSEPESSEVSEVFQHPPPVLRIGDKLLILRKGDSVSEKDATTPDSIITIIGAEGLQRGGVEESLEVHEVHLQPETEVQEIKIDSNEANLSTQNNYNTSESPQLEEVNNTADTNDLELKPAESTHILSLVKRKDKVTTTTTTTQATVTEKIDTPTTLTSSIEEPQSSELPSQSTELTTEKQITILPILSDVSTVLSSTIETQTKNVESLIEQNPAYPPIPDIMPARGEVSQKLETEAETDKILDSKTRILPDVIELLGNNTLNQTHSEWLKVENISNINDSLINFKAGTLPEELLRQKSPIDEDDDEIVTEAIDADSTVATTEQYLGLIDEIVIANDSDVGSIMTLSTAQPVTQTEANIAESNNVNHQGQLIAQVNIEASTAAPQIITIASIVSEGVESSDKHNETNLTTNLKETELFDNNKKSAESLEIDSGEQTTPKTNHSALLSNENASVEQKTDRSDLLSETIDLNKNSNKENAVELGSVEISDKSDEISFKDIEGISPLENDNVMKQDVELINVTNTPKPTKLTKVESSTYELLPTPEEAMSKTIIKRAISSAKAEDDIFKDLEKELSAESDHLQRSPEEENAEAAQVFEELLDESKSGQATKPKSEEQRKIENISNALAGVALKGQLPDASVFRLIGGLFGGQRE